jgi:hypothetical protein
MLYLRYDERYVYSAPELTSVTRRLEWSPSSSLFDENLSEFPSGGLDYQPRLARPDLSAADKFHSSVILIWYVWHEPRRTRNPRR